MRPPLIGDNRGSCKLHGNKTKVDVTLGSFLFFFFFLVGEGFFGPFAFVRG